MNLLRPKSRIAGKLSFPRILKNRRGLRTTGDNEIDRTIIVVVGADGSNVAHLFPPSPDASVTSVKVPSPLLRHITLLKFIGRCVEPYPCAARKLREPGDVQIDVSVVIVVDEGDARLKVIALQIRLTQLHS